MVIFRRISDLQIGGVALLGLAGWRCTHSSDVGTIQTRPGNDHHPATTERLTPV
jgi:hypothetical protein